jgi:Fe-S oxidoreductase
VKLVTVILGLIIMLSVPLSARAITFINRDVILEAQEYGVKRSQLPLSDFLQPWLAYEEQAAIINETTERAYLYTPFLLLAYDARDKAISKQTIELANSEQILADYAGCLVFSIIVNGNTEKFSDNVQVIIKQEKKIIKPYHAVINPPVKNSWTSKEPHYTAHYYFYFYERDVVLSKPITLTVTTKDKQERRFYFELPNFK